MIYQLLIAVDQLLNVPFYSKYDKETYGSGFGMADKTISARCYRLSNRSKFWSIMRKAVDFMFLWQSKSHCEYAYRDELKRKQLPPIYSKD